MIRLVDPLADAEIQDLLPSSDNISNDTKNLYFEREITQVDEDKKHEDEQNDIQEKIENSSK